MRNGGPGRSPANAPSLERDQREALVTFSVAARRLLEIKRGAQVWMKGRALKMARYGVRR
jgi:hypothetical protein